MNNYAVNVRVLFKTNHTDLIKFKDEWQVYDVSNDHERNTIIRADTLVTVKGEDSQTAIKLALAEAPGLGQFDFEHEAHLWVDHSLNGEVMPL